MIVVIADDITGAAELGGIALRYDLRVMLSEDLSFEQETDVLVLYTNTRSLARDEAVKVMEELTKKADDLQPSMLFKKVDSVLRGHVLAEMETQMKVLGMSKALLVPVNPLIGRSIWKEHYYVNGQPIHETGFATDPEYPVTTSNVREMLGVGYEEVHLLPQGSELVEGINVGEAETVEDLIQWTERAGDGIFLAGAASFFNALLSKRFEEKTAVTKPHLSSPILLVSGTTFHKNRERIKSLSHLASYMPQSLATPGQSTDQGNGIWSREVVKHLSTHQKAIIAIDGKQTNQVDAKTLREANAKVVREVLEKIPVKELLIEGGSTAYAVVKELGLSQFTPLQELQQGVVRMKVDGTEMHLTIKPGSYEWPPEWNFN